jgi:hypothetical protein
MAKLIGRESELFILSNKGKLRIRENSLVLWGVPALNSPKGWLGTKNNEAYVLITRPNMVEYRGWIGLSPPANYHNLSRDLAISTGKI